MNEESLAQRQWILKFVLTDFLGARVEDIINEHGSLEKCVCIPLDRNGLKIGSTGRVSSYAFVNKIRNANRYGWSHYIKLKTSKLFVRKLKDLGYDSPYLGNMKPSNYVYYKDSYDKKVKEDKVKLKDFE